jgi:tRNA A-37 threonylcarbamoyl transferase component Bud32
MSTTPHPEDERLAAYLLGNLSLEELEALESHVLGCASCRSRAGALEGRTDSFVDCLRGVGDEPADDAALKGLLERVRFISRPTTTFSEPAPLGTVAGHALLRELGRGGLGVVYLARHPDLGLRAIKRPQPRDDLDRRALLARFRREVRAVGALRHEHVVLAHDAGTDADGPYLVTEYLDGESLSSLVLRHRRLPVADACELVRQAALGLQAAHERGLVHRDIKPSNLMLARTGTGAARVVVIDWGLVKEAGTPDVPADDLTGMRTGMGTPDYIAPEQIRDAHAVDIRADVYSLGATFYCLLAGRAPFHEHEAFPRLGPDAPRKLTAVLNRMVEKDPARRFATPGEVAAALRPFCRSEQGLLALLGSDVPADPPELPRRRIGWLLAVAVGLLVLATALGLMLWGRTAGGGRTLGVAAVLGDGPAAPESMGARHPGYCSSLVFTPDGLYAVSESGGGAVYVWDLRKRGLKHSWLYAFQRPERNQDVSGVVAVSPDGNLLAAAGLNSFPRYMLLLSLYDPKTYERIGKDYTFSRMGRAIAFSPDSSRLATVDLPGVLGFLSPTLGIVEIQTGKWRKFACGSPVNGLAFSPDGKYLVTGGDDKGVRLWNLAAERQEREFVGHAGAVDQVAFSSDGKRLYSASGADGTLRVWDNGKDAGKEVMQIAVEKTAAKMQCATFWLGGRALTGHAGGSVVLWDLEKGEAVKRFAHDGTAITAVAISPDGHHAVAALANHRVYLYRLPPPGTEP